MVFEGVEVLKPLPLLKKIRVKSPNTDSVEKIQKEFNFSPLTARVLAARGFEAGEELRSFLDSTLRSDLPHPDKLKNLSEACLILKEGLERGKTIAICCDFDVDGLSSGAMLKTFFSEIGIEAKVFVPDRFTEGYGLNKRMIDEVVDEGCGILLALDFGSTNYSELLYAKERDLITIVIDHHHLGTKPLEVDSFINPEQEGCGFSDLQLCAAGLTWYFIAALRTFLPQAAAVDVRDYLEFSCLGTICDMVPLLGANRVIAKRGMERLNTTQRVGLRALLNVSGVKKNLSATDISFGVGPRINAAGRMSSGEMVIELLTTSDRKRADSLANKLDRLNAERQDLEKKIKKEVAFRISLMTRLPYGIVVGDKSFHTGVVGIVAQRIAETFYRPTAIIGSDENGVFKGSCRGIKGFNVVEALKNCADYLLGYGGHVGAGGFSLDEKNISAFSIAFNNEAERQLSPDDLFPICEVDTVADLSELTPKIIDELAIFTPYGIGNPAPVILLKNLRIVETFTLKSTHLKALVSDGKRTLPALLWNQTSHPAIKRGGVVNLACRPTLNSFNGLLEIQLQIQGAEAV